MAYISQHTGAEIDNSISINSTQNNRLDNLENNLSNLELTDLNNKIIAIITSQLEPIQNKIDTVNSSLNGLKFKALTFAEYNNLTDKDNSTLYIIID